MSTNDSSAKGDSPNRWDSFNRLICAFVLQAEDQKDDFFTPYAVAQSFGFHPRVVYATAQRMIQRKLLLMNSEAQKYGRVLVKPAKLAFEFCQVLKRIDIDQYHLDLVKRRDRITRGKMRDLDKIY